MTSSYLEKKPRDLKQVLAARGVVEDDGLADESASPVATPDPARRNTGTDWYIIGVSALVICVGLAAAIAMPVDQIAQEPNADDFANIAPASGPHPSQRHFMTIDGIDTQPDFGAMPEAPQFGTLEPE